MRIWFSDIPSYDDCPYQYYLKRVLGIKTELTSANLVFGKCVDTAVNAFLFAEVSGQAFDIVSAFEDAWDVETENHEIEYSSIWDPDSMRAAGRALVAQFPAKFRQMGYMPLLDDNGMPVVQYKIELPVGHGIVLVLKPDLIVLDPEQQVIVLDVKTPASATDILFAEQSEQLTTYQWGVESKKEPLAIERVDRVGFWDLIKRKVPVSGKGIGPEVTTPLTVRARPPEQIGALKQKIIRMASDIQAGRFDKTPRMAHNTPCSMCDFRDYCTYGDKTGLIFPQEAQRKLAV